jgi:hypothetical protein
MDEYKERDFWYIVKSEYFKTIHSPKLDDLIEKIAQSYPQSINKKGENGMTAIAYAITTKHVLATNILLKHGACINHIFIQDNHEYHGLTLLELAHNQAQKNKNDDSQIIYELLLAQTEKTQLEINVKKVENTESKNKIKL